MLGHDAVRRWVHGLHGVAGIDLKQLYCNTVYLPRYMHDLWHFHRQPGARRLRRGRLVPILRDFRDSAGAAQGHYFWQDLWAARKIYAAAPARHIDIGSRVDGFIAHLLTFRQVTLIDTRPLPHAVSGLDFIRDDATHLRGFVDGSVASISSLHAIEHFGLGRYGDPIDPNACFAAMASLTRVLAPGGRLYFSVPVGRERLEFNAHRVFAPSTILEAFCGLHLESFAAVHTDGSFDAAIQPHELSDAHYACGLFEFSRQA